MRAPRGPLVRGLLGGLVVSLWAGAGIAGWYQDASRSYYIDLPEAWIARARNSDAERMVALASPDGSAAVRIHVVPADPPVRVESLKATFETTIVPGARQLAANPSSLSGQQAVEAQYAWAAGGSTWSVTGRFLIAEKFGRSQGFIVWSMIREGAPAARQAEGGRLADSFSLLRPRGAFEVGTVLPEVAAPAAEAAFLLGDLRTAPVKPQAAAPAAAAAEPASQAPQAQVQPAVPPASPQPRQEAAFLPPQRSLPGERPGGPSKCLDATSATDCGCALADLRPAFADLEQAFVKASPAHGELRDAAAKIRDETSSTGGSCPPAAVGRANALAERVDAPEASWIVDRLEILKVCTDRALAAMTEQRGRPGLNKPLDAAVDEARMVKYDALSLLAEFERVRAERDAASALLGEVITGCRIVQGAR